ncbi:PREDICTED: putative F-box/kelch-repeat protein At5g02990, partial [Camelina sativa]|uniref:F-box/kelch-repeat protein At5g02990 n=1 Tax=Camelina sativa TaxID=90675 RepID=A0ABM1QCB2_CAMSA
KRKRDEGTIIRLFVVTTGHPFRSLIASPELEATRTRMGIVREAFVCLDLNKSNPNPSWFILSQVINDRQKLPTRRLLPLPSFPGQHPKSSTVLLVDSVIYIIGGLIGGNRSNRVLLLDCLSHQWRSLPNMRQPRVSPAADVIDGKIYVIGGCRSNYIENWGEVYDPKTQTWQSILHTALDDLISQKNVVPGRLVMRGKEYGMHGWNLILMTDTCLVDKVLRLISFMHKSLYWNDPEEDLEWRLVQGLEEVSHQLLYFHNQFNLVGNSEGGRRVTLWWKSVVTHSEGHQYCTEECKTEIWCGEVLFERRGLQELWGSVQWSKNVFTIDGCDSVLIYFCIL